MLRVNETFGPTVQGEGKSAGEDVVFLRLSGCNLACGWCDSILEGTLIRTANKVWTPIEQLAEGTAIIGIGPEKEHALTPRYGYVQATSTHLVSHTETQAIELKFSNGNSIVTTANHPIFTRRKNQPSTHSTFNWKWQWVTAENLKVGDVSWSVGKVPIVQETKDYRQGWLYGYTMGDGNHVKPHNKNRYRWETVTLEIRDRTLDFLSKEEAKFSTRVDRWNRTAKHTVYMTDANYLLVKNTSQEWKRGFVAGFYDAEGDNNGSHPQFHNQQVDLLLECQSYLKEFGFDSSLRKGHKCTILATKCSVPKRLEFDSLFYYAKLHDRKFLWNEPGLRGGTSSHKFRQGKDKVTVTRITRLTGKFKFYDIGSTSGNFIANGQVVHNTPYTWNWENTKFVHPDKYKRAEEEHKLSAKEVEARLEKIGTSCKRLVISGGEPFLQQKELIPLLTSLKQKGWYFEVETNGTIVPSEEFLNLIDQVNCSPKLTNSGPDNRASMRERPEALTKLTNSPKTSFKFVVQADADMDEILDLVHKYKMKEVYLMPEGRTKAEQLGRQSYVQRLASEYNFEFSPRLHVLEWDAKRAV